MQAIDQLWLDYNTYRFHTHWYLERVRARKIRACSLSKTSPKGKKLRSALESMAHWCAERNIDPRHWLYSLFQTRKWLHIVRYDQLISPNHLKRYTPTKQSVGFQNRIREEWTTQRKSEGNSYDPNRDTSNTTESLKRRYLSFDEADACMGSMPETLGFHPKSDVCGGCSLREDCAVQLQTLVNFDIQALRRGEITAQDAQMAAVSRGNRG